MVVYTDSPGLADRLLPSPSPQWHSVSFPSPEFELIRERLFDAGQRLARRTHEEIAFIHSLFVLEEAPRSQYDALIESIHDPVALPDGLVCIAGSGSGFHGHQARPWLAAAGNIHLSAHFAPRRDIPFPVAAVTALAAVSVVDTIDRINALRGKAGIKWVNDILIENAKVAGILAHTELSADGSPRIVIGIGLNVATSPEVAPTPFVPRVAALSDFTSPANVSQSSVLHLLLEELVRNYRTLVASPDNDLRDKYRARSLVLGRNIAICADRSEGEPVVIARGRVDALGDELELYLAGVERPFAHGRVILE